MQNGSSKLPSTESTVTVVGLGKIGLPLAVQYARLGWLVIGCDSNPEVVETVNAGKSHAQEEPELATEVARLVESGLLSATVRTTDAVRYANVVIVKRIEAIIGSLAHRSVLILGVMNIHYISIGDGRQEKQDRSSDKQPVAAVISKNGGGL